MPYHDDLDATTEHYTCPNCGPLTVLELDDDDEHCAKCGALPSVKVETRREAMQTPESLKVLAMLRQPDLPSRVWSLDNNELLALWMLLGLWLKLHPNDERLHRANRAIEAEGAKRKPS